MITYDDFLKVEIRVGTIIEASHFREAKNPAIKLKIDFGPYGTKQSSAHLSKRYQPQQLIGKQVVAVINFPKKKIAGFDSEVLVLGACPDDTDVILLSTDFKAENGTRIL